VTCRKRSIRYPTTAGIVEYRRRRGVEMTALGERAAPQP
jgi:hypothetical protein